MTEDERIDALGTIFRCSPEAARLLLSLFVLRDVPSGAILVEQGLACSQCWIVIDGSVRVNALGLDGQQQQLSHYGPGEVFGAYPDAQLSRAEISTASRSRLLCAPSSQLCTLVETHTELASGLARLLARQLDRALDRMVMRTTFSAAGRVYAELLALAGPSGAVSPAPRITSLALAANTTRETASRAINVLIRRGIVTREEDTMVIQSRRMLQEMIC